MKLGDLVHKLDLSKINAFLENTSPDEFDVIKAKTRAMAFLVDMASEVIEAPTIEKSKMSINEMSYFSVEVLAGAAAMATFRFAKRTNNFDAYVNAFKQVYENVISNMKGFSK